MNLLSIDKNGCCDEEEVVRSRVTVGWPEEDGEEEVWRKDDLGFGVMLLPEREKLRPCRLAAAEEEEEESESSMEAAAEVAEAMAVADIGSGWLCVPSYVEISIDISSEHLCT